MVHRRPAAALAAALILAVMLPAVAVPGVARAADPTAEAWPPPLPVVSTIYGHAAGTDGGSLAGGTVTACSIAMPGCRSATIAYGGTFAIVVLTGDVYRVSIDPPYPYVPGFYAESAIGAFSPYPSEASPVPVYSGDVTLLPIIVPRPPAPPTAGAISGHVFGLDAGSLAGGTATACSFTWSCRTATIRSDGFYRIGSVPTGTYTLAIEPPPYSPYVSGYFAAWAVGNFTTSASNATPFSVAAAEVVLPTMVVPWSWPVPTTGSISGTVTGAGGAPLVGATVTACSSTWSCLSATVGSGGAYWIGYLPAGDYVVSITPPSSAYLIGYYSSSASGHFTTSASLATVVSVWGTGVALPTVVVPWAVTYGAISGYVQGLSAGALAGGTVTVCSAAAACANATIGSGGAYWIGSLPSGSYTVKVTPTAGSGYSTGYYASTAPGYFTTNAASATVVSVAGATVTLPTIVPPWTGSGTGGIVIGKPQAYVVWAYLRPEFTDGTTTSLRITEGERAELASYVDPQLSGMRVEVWRRLQGRSWVMITTRGISGAGWVIYRFTATRGTNGAQFRFHLPATSLTVSVWSVARTVRLL
jgi:hypothetical protein